MKRTIMLVIAACTTATLMAQPVYKSSETKMIIEQMLESHGGYDTWAEAEAIRFTKKATPRLPNGQLTTKPWVTEETIHTQSERAIIELPEDEGIIVKNGEEIWDINISAAKKNAVRPAMLSLMTYKFTNLPWLVQQDGVVLEDAKTVTIPNDSKEYHSIKITFDKSFGYAIGDFYRIYIDPESHLVKAVSFSINMGKFIPGGPTTPEMIHVFNTYETVSSLVFPTQYHTYQLNSDARDAEGKQPFGAVHDIWGWELLDSFDEAKMTKPSGAESTKDMFSKGGRS